MIVELRQYVPVPGKGEALLHRLETSSFALFQKMGIHVKDLWLAPDTGDVWYTVAWNSRQEMQERWEAFRNSPDWIRSKAESEKDGPLMASMNSYVLVEHPIKLPA